MHIMTMKSGVGQNQRLVEVTTFPPFTASQRGQENATKGTTRFMLYRIGGQSATFASALCKDIAY